MVASDSFAEFLREQLAPIGRITMRRMFGKTGVFCDDVMLGMVTENTLYFRVDDQNRRAACGARGFSLLERPEHEVRRGVERVERRKAVTQRHPDKRQGGQRPERGPDRDERPERPDPCGAPLLHGTAILPQ